MSKSTVRKEPTLAEYSGDHQGASAANIADEFERFFSENARMMTPAVRPAPQPLTVAPEVAVAAQPASPVIPAYDDPLMAELARIVGPGALARITAPPATANEPPAQRPHDPLAAFEEELRRFDAMHRAQSAPPPAAVEQGASAPTAEALAAPVGYDPMAGLEAELARMHQPQQAEFAVSTESELRGAQGDPINIPPSAPEYTGAPSEAYAQDFQEPVPDLAAAAADSRSRKVVILLSTAAVIAVIGIVGAVVGKGGKKVAGEPPVIAAKTLPMKEKPADPGGAEIPGQDRQVLAKGQGEPAVAPKIVSKEEQPVDLAQTPKREVARVILPAPQGASGGAPAPAAPILMPPPAVQPAPEAAAPAAAVPNAGGFEAKRVRSVRVGADGESPVAARPAAPAAPAPAPVPVAAAPAPAPVAAEPAPKPVAAAPTPQRIDPPKSESRPATATRASQPTTTPQPARTAARANPAPAPAPAPAAEQAGENAPMSLRPPAGALATRPVARNTTPAATAAAGTTAITGGGKFAVQLGAPPTQEEAQRMASRMKQQHSGALGGASPGVRAAKVGEKTVYRVRVGGLSRDAANTMCANIKSSGGSCFVASN